MKQKIVGNFPMGVEYCELVLREGTGGEFYVMPEKGHIPRIKIGADHEEGVGDMDAGIEGKEANPHEAVSE